MPASHDGTETRCEPLLTKMSHVETMTFIIQNLLFHRLLSRVSVRARVCTQKRVTLNMNMYIWTQIKATSKNK